MGLRNKIKKRLPIFGRRFSNANQEKSTPTSSNVAPPPPAPQVEEEPKSIRGDQDVQSFLESFVKDNKIVLFMKGVPTNPLCGFSANAAGILSSYGKEFTHFNVIADYDVREGVKDFSSWPTLPQIYLGGEFIGGSDILSQMHESGELQQAIDELFPG